MSSTCVSETLSLCSNVKIDHSELLQSLEKKLRKDSSSICEWFSVFTLQGEKYKQKNVTLFFSQMKSQNHICVLIPLLTVIIINPKTTLSPDVSSVFVF